MTVAREEPDNRHQHEHCRRKEQNKGEQRRAGKNVSTVPEKHQKKMIQDGDEYRKEKRAAHAPDNENQQTSSEDPGNAGTVTDDGRRHCRFLTV